jgi:ABC-2 type transport system permease protein
MVDSSDPVVLGAAQGLATLQMPARAEPRWRVGTSNTFEVRAYYNPERRSAVEIVPGLIGVILSLTMVLFTAVAIVRERERGNFELLITTPVKTSELMVGKILPYIGIGLVQTTLALAVGALIFAMPIRGSLVNVYLAALVYIAASLSLGLLISTAVQTQFQAMQMAVITFLPQILLSGFMFPFESMPAFARKVGELLPLTHFVRIIRGILLRGAGFAELRSDLAPLGVFFVVTMVLAIARFRKRLD